MKQLLRWPVLWWLRFWAKLVIARVHPTIIGVTGSAGKTSSIEAIRHVAAAKFKNVKVAKKANSESGIPADILGLHFIDYSPLDWLRVCLLAPLFSSRQWLATSRSSFDCYIVELGVDEPTPPKNMSYLLSIIKPHIGVILNALPVHTEQFGMQLGLTDQQKIVSAITKEKGKLVTENQNLRTAILNSDQKEISKLAIPKTAKRITFGTNKNSDVIVRSVTPSLTKSTASLIIRHLPFVIEIPSLALPSFYGHTFASALAVGLALGVDPKDASNAITNNFHLSPGRGQILRGIKNTTIIDSSYNASRETMIGSLKLLSAICHGRRALGILGDMRELGNQAKTEHEEVARVASETLDEAVLVGPLMKQYVDPILQKRIPTHWFPTAGEAARFMLTVLKGDEIILVKGSQNTIFLEIIVEALLADKSDISKLCRRGTYWDRQRAPYQ